jgi:hypothetical protein
VAGKTVKNETRRAEREANIARSIELRIAGLSLAQIGRELGVTEATACKYVKTALSRLNERALDNADHLRAIELERLDKLQRAAERVLSKNHVIISGGKVVCNGDAQLTDDGPVLQAIDRLLRIAESRRRLLGLDSPARVEHSGPDGGPIEIADAAKDARERISSRIASIAAAKRASGDSR